MCSALGAVMGRPSWLPVPEFALKTLLGEGASVVLDGQRVMPARTQEAGFSFQYSEIGDAIRNVMRR
uniref:Epimerase family protein slr1223-like n=1 Tax=Tetraselmis sp. GSL018 TaxID=582737 RepID=A0A061SI94_9CHLO